MTGRVEIKGGRLENDSLVVAFAKTFAFDTISAYRSLFATLDAALATRQTSGLGPLPVESSFERTLCRRRCRERVIVAFGLPG